MNAEADRKPRVLVAMSGGVDSAVAAALLHQQGYDIVGVTLRLYTEPDVSALRSRRTCCGVEDVADARAAAQRIGIPHYVLNMEREFERDVIDPFAAAYAQGRTPNPCLSCNDRVKFATLLDRADALGFDILATGHYARIEQPDAPHGPEGREGREGCSERRSEEHSGGRYALLAAADDAKDQSYVLYTLGQRQLARLRFPLGELPKSETRRIAADLGLGVASKPDSADICFVPGGDYRELLRERGIDSAAGAIVDSAGAELGRHDGVAGFTIGQRRGLGIATAGRRYVTDIDVASGVVTVGLHHELQSAELHASDPRWVAAPPAEGERLHARIRYHGAPLPAAIDAMTPDAFRLRFERPAYAVTPGQAVVLYRGDEVVGGGTIERDTARPRPEGRT